MDLQQLRSAVDVAETSSFTRAAERRFLTQSALSHQIAALERELGQRLFERSSREVRVTEAGEAFVIHARFAVRSADAAREAAAATAGRVVGTLRLGVIPTVTAVSPPALIASFRRAHPAVRVELVTGTSDELARRISDGEIDVAFLGLRADVRPMRVAWRELDRARLVAVLHREHASANSRSLELHELAGEVFVDFPAATSGRAQSDHAFSSAGLSRDVAFEAGTTDLILGLVGAGVAVALLPQDVAIGEDIAVVPVAGGPERVEYVAWHERSPRSAATAFLRLLDASTPT